MYPLKLLIDEPQYDIEPLVVEKNKNDEQSLYIRGPYLLCNEKNKNGRIYTLDEMIKEVERYKKEMISEKRSLGELNHPTSVEVNPERACHMIVEMKQDGNVFYGKSKILSNPMGQLTRSLLMDGVKLGISSRALGKLVPCDNDAKKVEGLHLICCDVVHDPSVSTAFVNGILESKDWILNSDGTILEAYEGFEKSIQTLPKHSEEREKILKENILMFINRLGSKKQSTNTK